MRRTFIATGIAIAALFVASVAAIHAMTRDAPSTAPVAEMAPRVTEAPGTVAPPPPVAAAPAPPGVSEPSRPRPVAAPPPVPAGRTAGAPPGGRGARAGADLALSFKLDPRLTRGLHMGERWVSPRTYSTIGDPNAVTVLARAQVLADGRPVAAAATWTASEPEMVNVSSGENAEVEITVWRPGESSLVVRAGEASRTLVVRAEQAGGGLRVSIVQ